jgi:hypothetical protein
VQKPADCGRQGGYSHKQTEEQLSCSEFVDDCVLHTLYSIDDIRGITPEAFVARIFSGVSDLLVRTRGPILAAQASIKIFCRVIGPRGNAHRAGTQYLRMRDVRFGSLAVMATSQRDVRFTPESGQIFQICGIARVIAVNWPLRQLRFWSPSISWQLIPASRMRRTISTAARHLSKSRSCGD